MIRLNYKSDWFTRNKNKNCLFPNTNHCIFEIQLEKVDSRCLNERFKRGKRKISSLLIRIDIFCCCKQMIHILYMIHW